MMAAADFAAVYASAERLAFASGSSSRSTFGEREAIAQARTVPPQSCCCGSSLLPMTEPRFSFRSLAKSGTADFSSSSAWWYQLTRPRGARPGPGCSRPWSSCTGTARRSAGVEDPQDLLGGVTAHGTGGHHRELDLVVLVDDEDGALGEAVLALDAEVAHELVLRVGQHREGQVGEVRVVLAPGVVHELGVAGEAEDLGVAVGELVVQLPEGGDLGGGTRR